MRLALSCSLPKGKSTRRYYTLVFYVIAASGVFGQNNREPFWYPQHDAFASYDTAAFHHWPLQSGIGGVCFHAHGARGSNGMRCTKPAGKFSFSAVQPGAARSRKTKT